MTRNSHSSSQADRRSPAALVILGMVSVAILANLVAAYLGARVPQASAVWFLDELGPKQAQMEKFATSGEPTSVVLIGDSTVDTGIAPQIIAEYSSTHIRVYNAALGGTSPEVWNLWMQELVEPLLHPQLVVIGIGPEDLMDASGLAPSITRYRGSPARLAQLRNTPWSKLAQLLPVVRYRAALTQTDFVRAGLTGSWTDAGWESLLTPSGWRAKWSAASFQVPESWERNHTRADHRVTQGTQYNAIATLIEAMNASGVQVAILRMPDLPELRPINLSEPEREYKEYLRLTERLSSTYDAPLWDAHDLPWTTADFADPHHLNGAGTRTLSAWLATHLDNTLPET